MSTSSFPFPYTSIEQIAEAMIKFYCSSKNSSSEKTRMNAKKYSDQLWNSLSLDQQKETADLMMTKCTSCEIPNS